MGIIDIIKQLGMLASTVRCKNSQLVWAPICLRSCYMSFNISLEGENDISADLSTVFLIYFNWSSSV